MDHNDQYQEAYTSYKDTVVDNLAHETLTINTSTEDSPEKNEIPIKQELINTVISENELIENSYKALVRSVRQAKYVMDELKSKIQNYESQILQKKQELTSLGLDTSHINLENPNYNDASSVTDAINTQISNIYCPHLIAKVEEIRQAAISQQSQNISSLTHDLRILLDQLDKEANKPSLINELDNLCKNYQTAKQNSDSAETRFRIPLDLLNV